MEARPKPQMTSAHKAALAEGRAQGKAIRDYLDALDQHRPKRGRKRTRESVAKRLKAVEHELNDAGGIKRLELLQARRDLTAELAGMDQQVDLTAVEEGFVKAAKSYSERKGISYSTWREAGISADVLKRAGIGRGSA